MNEVNCSESGDEGANLTELLVCWTCDGSGKVRANYTNNEGRYVFRKLACSDCGGTGEHKEAH